MFLLYRALFPCLLLRFRNVASFKNRGGVLDSFREDERAPRREQHGRGHEQRDGVDLRDGGSLAVVHAAASPCGNTSSSASGGSGSACMASAMRSNNGSSRDAVTTRKPGEDVGTDERRDPVQS